MKQGTEVDRGQGKKYATALRQAEIFKGRVPALPRKCRKWNHPHPQGKEDTSACPSHEDQGSRKLEIADQADQKTKR